LASLTRTGAPNESLVNDPFGFTHVVESIVLADNASTRDPCDRAAIRADNSSGLLVTAAAFARAATFTGAAA
jgi:hypothetical protein